MEIVVVYVGETSKTIEIREDNFEKAGELESNLIQYFPSGDYWIDNMWLEDSDVNLDSYKGIFYDTRLIIENIEEFFNTDDSERIEYLLKRDFIINYLNSDITQDLIDSIYIEEEGTIEYIENEKFPKDLSYKLFGEFYPDLLKKLEDIHCDNYFDYCLWLRDLGYNGGISYDIYTLKSPSYKHYVVYTLT